MRQILVQLPALYAGIAFLVLAGVLQWRKNSNASLCWTLAAVFLGYFAWKGFKVDANLPVYSYGVMLALGALAGIYIASRRAHIADLTKDELIDFGLYIVLWGVVGARLFHVVFYQARDFFGSPKGFLRIFAIWEGGLVWYGAVAAGIGYLFWFIFVKKKTGWRGWLRLGDLVVPSGVLGLAFGRMGCFLNGCCWGKVAKALPWAVTFPKGSHAYRYHIETIRSFTSAAERSLPVHPTQLYSILGALAVWGLLELTLKKRKFDCMTGFTFLMAYACVRFTIEFFRADNVPYLGLTFSQHVGVIAFCAGAFFFVRGWLRARRVQA